MQRLSFSIGEGSAPGRDIQRLGVACLLSFFSLYFYLPLFALFGFIMVYFSLRFLLSSLCGLKCEKTKQQSFHVSRPILLVDKLSTEHEVFQQSLMFHFENTTIVTVVDTALWS